MGNFLSGLQTGSNLLTAGYNIFNNERAHREQQENNKTEVELANSQIQRGLADAHSAGLSTAQWLSMNGVAGSPSLGTMQGTVSAPDVQSPWLKHKEMQRAEVLADLQQAQIQAGIEKTEAETEAIKKTTELDVQEKESRIQQIASNIELNDYQIKKIEREFDMNPKAWLLAIVGALLGVDTGSAVQNATIQQISAKVPEIVEYVKGQVDNLVPDPVGDIKSTASSLSESVRETASSVVDKVYDQFDTVGGWKLSHGVISSGYKAVVCKIHERVGAKVSSFVEEVKESEDSNSLVFYVRGLDDDIHKVFIEKKLDIEKICDILYDEVASIRNNWENPKTINKGDKPYNEAPSKSIWK